jgi:hypothetical protein
MAAGIALRCRSVSRSASIATFRPTDFRWRKQSTSMRGIVNIRTLTFSIIWVSTSDCSSLSDIRTILTRALLDGSPLLGTDGHPDLARPLICQFVIGEGGSEANNSLRYALRSLGEIVVDIDLSIGKLVEATRKAEHGAVGKQAGHSSCGYAFSDELADTHHAIPREQPTSPLGLRLRCVMFPRSLVHNYRGFVT